MNHKNFISISLSGLLLLVCFISLNALAAGINIEHVNIFQQGDYVYLDAKVDCELSDESIEALNHGVPLHILVMIQIQKPRRFFWGKTIKDSTIAYKIEYHPLSERYVLTELNTFQQEDFRSLNNALDALGHIDSWPLISMNKLDKTKQYFVSMKAKLDIESLPAPLRPTAYISKNWRLNSGWRRWELPL